MNAHLNGEFVVIAKAKKKKSSKHTPILFSKCKSIMLIVLHVYALSPIDDLSAYNLINI